MNPERWQRITEIFNRCLKLDPEERRELWRSEELDPEDIQIIEELLANDRSTQGSDLSFTGRVREAISDGLVDTEQVEGFRLLSILGQGGQGTVYLAEWLDEDLDGKVAIKILQSPALFASDSTESPMAKRFQRERRILSGLDHPHVARFFNAGTTRDGRPYFVMEAVDGEPIDVYCKTHDLTRNQRLELFCQVAEAVQAVHRRLIIHRDIKPSNLLVTSDGRPKLLDFGIARLLEPDQPFDVTATGRRMWTPSVASPEQVVGDTLTTATDVYSLGVLLYLLLTDHRAHIFPQAQPSPTEVERVICEQEPLPPSAVAGRDLKGDLDAIVMKALRKEPDRRFGSVEQMVDDVRRFLDGLPVNARPAGWRYRAGKFMRRHRVPLSITTAVLVLTASISAFFMDKVRDERDRAVAVTEFVEEVFGVADANTAQGEDVLLRPVLDSATSKILQRQDHPSIQADLMMLFGSIYLTLGLHGEAEQLLNGALEARQSIHGEQHPEVAESLQKLGWLQIEKNRIDDAEQSFELALNIQLRSLEADHELVLKSRLGLATTAWKRGHFGESLAQSRRLIDQWRRRIEGSQLDSEKALGLAGALDLAAASMGGQGQISGAEALRRQALETLGRGRIEDHLLAADLWSNLSFNLRMAKRYEEAVEASAEAVRIDEKLLGPSSIRLGIDLLNLGIAQRRAGQPQESLASCTRGLEMTRKLRSETHPNLLPLSECVGRAYEALDEHERALDFHRWTLEARSPALEGGTKKEILDVTRSMYRIASVLTALDRHAEAEAMWRSCVELRRRHSAPGSGALTRAECGLGRSLQRLARIEEAEPLLKLCETS